MSPARLWPIAIVAVLAVTVGANVLLLWQASGPDAAVIEPNYYARAVAWDSTLAERAHDEALGWHLEATLGAPGQAGIPIAVWLTDANHAAIAHAVIALEAIHNADPARRVHLTLHGDSLRYAGVLPSRHAGRWELRFEVHARGERFTAVLHRDTGETP
jgi:nitrogen fixation protein FixH